MMDLRPYLTDDLRRKPWRGHPNPLAGHCYVASEVLYHLWGGKDAGLTPQFVRHEGQPHWFLADKQLGIIIDPTADQFGTPVPYAEARGCGFLTRAPSMRAQVVLARIAEDSA